MDLILDRASQNIIAEQILTGHFDTSEAVIETSLKGLKERDEKILDKDLLNHEVEAGNVLA